MMPLTSSWKKNAIRCEFCLSLGCARWNVGRLPTCYRHHSGPRDGMPAGCRHAITQRHPLSRSARDQLVLAGRVDLEEEELAVGVVPVRVKADGLPEDRG